MSVLILLIALILAGASAWFFLQWNCPSKQEKIKTLVETSELEKEIDFNESLTLTPQQIKEAKTKISEEIKKAQELQKKKEEELNDEEKEAVTKLSALQEIQNLAQDINSKEDLTKKVYGNWDYVYAGGVALGIFFLSVWLFGKFFGIMKIGEEK